MKLTSPCLAAIVLSSSLLAQREFTRLAVPEDMTTVHRDDHYGIYFKESKIGWMQVATRTDERDGETVLLRTTNMSMAVKAFGEEMTMTGAGEDLFSPKAPHRYLGGWLENADADESQRITAKADGENLRVVIQTGENRREETIPLPDFTFADVATETLWFREDREVGARARVRGFDLSALEEDNMAYRVKGKKETTVDGVPLAYYEVSATSSKSGPLGLFRVDRTGRVLSGRIAGMIEFRIEPKVMARDLSATLDLFAEGMAKVDRPLGDPTTVTSLVVVVSGPGAERIRSTPWQTATRDAAKQTTTLSIGKAHGQPSKATAKEIDRYLASTVDYPTRDERIVELVARALGDAKTTKEKVGRLVAFVDEFIEDSYTAEPLTVHHILERRQGDCSEHAQLFTTMARAAGIPCREVGGLIYMGDESSTFGGHAWNQVVIDGHWVPVDPTWGETEINATHIALSIGEDDLAGAATMFAGLDLEVVSFER